MGNSKSYFRADLEKYYLIELGSANPSLYSKLKLWTFHFGLHCGTVYRFCQFARRLKKRFWLLGVPFVIVARVLDLQARFLHHVHICEAIIGPGFYIGHVGTIYLAPTEIGKNLSIAHNVTIGVGHISGQKGVPLSIGDNVWIGTGSVLSGPISIGNNVTIAGGCYLSRSVPDGCLVGGNPGRVILRHYDNEYLFGNAGETPTEAEPIIDEPVAVEPTEPSVKQSEG